MKIKTEYFLTAINLLIFIFLLICFFIPLSPPLFISWSRGLWNDEGNLLHNIKNYWIHKQFIVDSCNFITLSPLYFLYNFLISFFIPLKLIYFKIANSIWMLLSIFIWSITFFKKTYLRLLTINILFFNIYIFSYGKSTLAENIMLFFLLLSFYFILKKSPFLSALTSILAIFTKFFAIFHLLTLAITAFLEKNNFLRKILKLSSYFWAFYLLFQFIFFSITFNPLQAPREISLRLPASLEQLGKNILTVWLNPFFTKNFPLFLAFFIILWKKKEWTFAEKINIYWILSLSLFLSFQNYHPPRYYLSLLFPLYFLPLKEITRDITDKSQESTIPILIKFTLTTLFLLTIFLLFTTTDSVGKIALILTLFLLIYPLFSSLTYKSYKILLFSLLSFQIILQGYNFHKWFYNYQENYFSSLTQVENFILQEPAPIVGENWATQIGFNLPLPVYFSRQKKEIISISKKRNLKKFYLIWEEKIQPLNKWVTSHFPIRKKIKITIGKFKINCYLLHSD